MPKQERKRNQKNTPTELFPAVRGTDLLHSNDDDFAPEELPSAHTMTSVLPVNDFPSPDKETPHSYTN